MPPGQFFEIYAIRDSVVAARYFYMLETLHITELSRRYDALVRQPMAPNIHQAAYANLTRIMCNLPFTDTG